MANLKILAFSGSTRLASFNTSAIRAAVTLVPDGMEIEIFDLTPLPFMDQDLEKDGVWPESVATFRQKIKEADGILVSTPEYNNMVPGFLKNAFEWASRNTLDSTPLTDKPMAIMGASDGGFGTVRAQLQMLTLGSLLNMRVRGAMRLPISEAQNKFDEKGNLTDEDMKEKLQAFLVNFKEWILTTK